MPTSKRADFAMEAAELTAQVERLMRDVPALHKAEVLDGADLSRTRADLVAQLEALDDKIGSLLERNSGLEASSTSSYGSIFATWLAVVGSVVVGMLIAHDYLAERYTAFYQGRTIDIGAHPGYDAIFWAAGLIATFAATAAAVVTATSPTEVTPVVRV